MQKTPVAQPQPTDGQAVPEQGQPPLTSSPSFTAEHGTVWCGMSLWSVGVRCPQCVPSQRLLHLQSARWRRGMRSTRGVSLLFQLQNASFAHLTAFYPCPFPVARRRLADGLSFGQWWVCPSWDRLEGALSHTGAASRVFSDKPPQQPNPCHVNPV